MTNIKQTEKQMSDEIRYLNYEIIALRRRISEEEKVADKYRKIRKYMHDEHWICFDSPDEGETDALEMIKELERLRKRR
jgi:predicted protein tyrosine phosphatase